ncbi:hypothetical protein SM033_00043 [Vibrio phage vB_VpaM_sm033]|nr:hypothetical protein SM033_00043 [Vibrio phage vB_VpaM_sm033]
MNTERPLRKIVSMSTKEDPANDLYQTIINTANFLVERTGAESINAEPEVNPNVNTYDYYDQSKAYAVGDELRSAQGYFRCVQDISASQTVDITDRNYWKLFWMPAQDLTAFGGMYTNTLEYPAGVTVLYEQGSEILVLVSQVLIPANTAFDISKFKITQRIPKV